MLIQDSQSSNYTLTGKTYLDQLRGFFIVWKTQKIFS